MRAQNKELSMVNEDLQAKYALLEGSLNETLKKKQEQAKRSAKRMIQMMKGKALTSTFMAWCVFTRESKEDRIKMERFLAKWKTQGVAKCYVAWTTFVVDEKHYRYVIARFRTRMMSLDVAKSLDSWKDFTALRLRIKYLARRIVNRCKYGQLLSAWLPWVEFINAMKEKEKMDFVTTAQREAVDERLRLIKKMVNTESEREEAEVERKKAQGLKIWRHEKEKAELEARHAGEKLILEKKISALTKAEIERKKGQGLKAWRHEQEKAALEAKIVAMASTEAKRKTDLGLKMIQKMMNACVAKVLQGWKEFVKVEKGERKALALQTKLASVLSDERLDKWKRDAVAEMRINEGSALEAKLDEMLYEVEEVERGTENRLAVEVEGLRAKLEEVGVELERVRGGKDYAIGRGRDLEVEVEALKAEKEIADVEVGEMGGRVGELEAEVEVLKAEKEGQEVLRRTQLGKVEVEREELKMKLGEVEVATQELKAGREELKMKLSDADATAQEMKQKSEELKMKLSDAQTKHEELKTKLGGADTSAQEMQTKHEELKIELGDAVATTQEMQKKHKEQKSKLSEADATAQEMQAKHEELLKVNTEMKAGHEITVAKLETVQSDELRELRIGFEKELEEVREAIRWASDAEELVVKMQAEHEDELEAARSEYASESMKRDLFIATMKARETELQREVGEVRSECDNEINHMKARATEMQRVAELAATSVAEEEISKLKASFEREREATARVAEEEIAKLKEITVTVTEEEIAKLQTAFEQELNAVQSERDNSTVTLQDEIKFLKSREAKVQQIAISVAEEKIAKLQAGFEREIEAANLKVGALEEELEAVRVAARSDTIKFQEELEAVKSEHASDGMKHDLLGATSRAHSRKLEDEIEALRAKGEKNTVDLHTQTQRAVLAKSEAEEKVEAVLNDHATESMKRDLFEAGLNADKKKLEDEVKALKKVADTGRGVDFETASLLQSELDGLVAERERDKEYFRDLKGQYDANVVELGGLKEELAEKLEARTDEVRERTEEVRVLKEMLKGVEQAKAKELTTLKETLKGVEQAKAEELTALKKSLSDIEQSRISELTSSFEFQLQQLQSKLSSLDAKNASLEIDLEESRVAEAKLDSVQERYEGLLKMQTMVDNSATNGVNLLNLKAENERLKERCEGLVDMQGLNETQALNVSRSMSTLTAENEKLKEETFQVNLKLDYVRNVLVHYMLAEDEGTRKKMEPALLETLEVGEEERRKVEGRGGGWLW
ncbi:hypothetical protein TrLO_g8996 [Triparma laevis f. longispina]|uniref:GRIP domain-containing protein n=3 Tax=Triparma laevis f. longispina TaxID=1714387 RepID=A0A9W7EJA9_9STRA|nr:hypothetical protein TrLO_g8996 [Triparma laevis f. longispina]